MKKLTKIVIPVAGLGTRVLPASKVVPKELLTVVDKPVIQHVIEEAVQAGFSEIILVTRSGKSMIEDHFDSHFELEANLAAKGKDDLLQSVKDILPEHVSISSVRQSAPLGLGHAVLCAQALIGDDDFAVSLADVLIHHHQGAHHTDLSTLVTKFNSTGAAQIMVEAVADEDVDKYGIVDCGNADFASGESHNIVAMVEKPPVGSAPSNQSIIGRYILPARTMQLLKETKPGAGGEIQLTDAIDQLIKETPVEACPMQGKTYDCGNKSGYMIANLRFALDHAETGEAVKTWIKNLDL